MTKQTGKGVRDTLLICVKLLEREDGSHKFREKIDLYEPYKEMFPRMFETGQLMTAAILCTREKRLHKENHCRNFHAELKEESKTNGYTVNSFSEMDLSSPKVNRPPGAQAEEVYFAGRIFEDISSFYDLISEILKTVYGISEEEQARLKNARDQADKTFETMGGLLDKYPEMAADFYKNAMKPVHEELDRIWKGLEENLPPGAPKSCRVLCVLPEELYEKIRSGELPLPSQVRYAALFDDNFIKEKTNFQKKEAAVEKKTGGALVENKKEKELGNFQTTINPQLETYFKNILSDNIDTKQSEFLRRIYKHQFMDMIIEYLQKPGGEKYTEEENPGREPDAPQKKHSDH